MNETVARRLTGTTAIAAAAALIIEVPLCFVYSGPPPASNVLASLLLGILGPAFLVLFVTAFREPRRPGRRGGPESRPGAPALRPKRAGLGTAQAELRTTLTAFAPNLLFRHTRGRGAGPGAGRDRSPRP